MPASPLTPFLLGLALLLPVASHAADLPGPPCGGAIDPPLAAPGHPPATQTWSESALRGWQPPACLGWGGGRSRMVAAVSAEIHSRETLGELLSQLGAFSAYPSIPY